MTRFALIITLLFSTAFAQNAAFLPFGSTSGDVNNHIASLAYFNGEVKEDTNTLTKLVSDQHNVIYSFSKKALYAVEDQRQFSDRKQASQVIKSCLTYMNRMDVKPRKINAEKDTERYAAVMADRITELVVKFDRKTKITTVSLKATSRNFGPRMQTEAFASSVMYGE